VAHVEWIQRMERKYEGKRVTGERYVDENSKMDLK